MNSCQIAVIYGQVVLLKSASVHLINFTGDRVMEQSLRWRREFPEGERVGVCRQAC